MTASGTHGRGRVGIFTTDTDLVVRTWDEALTVMTGIDPSAAIGRPLEDVVPSLRERGLLDMLREPLLSGSPVVLAPALHRYLIPCPAVESTAEFDHMQQRVVIGALRNDDAAEGLVVTIEDVTARLNREREIARQLRDVDPAERLAAVKSLAAEDAQDAAQLTGVIADDDWRVRRAAVKQLGRTRDAALVGAVVTALRDGHRNFSLLSSALQLLTLTGVDLGGALIALLHDPDEDLRIQAALALGTQRSREAVDALIGALDDPDANVRFHAIEALGKLAPPEAIERLSAVIDSGDFFLTFAAIEALVRVGDPVVAPRLALLLSDPMLAASAAEALGRIGDESVIDALVMALASDDAPVEALASALAAIHRRYEQALGGAAEIEDRVTRGLSEEAGQRLSRAVAVAAGAPLRDLVLVVGWMRSPSAADTLARLLGSPGVSHDVIEALVRHGAPAVDLLIAQLQHGEDAARNAAATALGRIGDRRAVPGLIALLGEDTRDAWLPAIGALGGIGDRRAFAPLLALLGDGDAGIRQAAVGALNSIGHPDMESRIADLLESPDPYTRESAVKIAGYFGYASCVGRFLERCRDPHESVRSAALEHLPYFDHPGVVEILRRALEVETPRGRAAAAQALGAVVDPHAVTLLVRALADPEPWVRYFAVIGLGQHRASGAVAPLVRVAAEDSAQHVRAAAIEALGAIGDEQAIRAIEPLVADADEDVGHAAMRVLGRLRVSGAGAMLAEALRARDPRRRRVAVEALTTMADLGAVDQLRWTVAADEDARVSEAALTGLVQIANEGGAASAAAVDALLALTAEDKCREGAVSAVARLRPPSIPRVAAGLDNPDPQQRAAVVDALTRMLHPAATACVQRALDDADDIVRRQAVTGIARIGTRSALERLAAMADRDRSPLVRRAAAAALAHDRDPRYSSGGL